MANATSDRLHPLDKLSRDERLKADRDALERFAKRGVRGPVWIEEQWMGQAQFTYRPGDFGYSGRYRYVGMIEGDGAISLNWPEGTF